MAGSVSPALSPLTVDTFSLSGLDCCFLMRPVSLAFGALIFALSPCFEANALGGNAVAAKSVPSAAPLPLALNDDFRVEKVFSLRIDPAVSSVPAQSGAASWLQMETSRRYFGAINSFERSLRDGHSYTIHWRVRPQVKGEVTVRFEYRQQKLGSHVQTQDVVYPKASGSMRTEFAVQGDDYHQDGAVTAWRVLLIQDGRVVGLQQSFLW